MGIDAAGDCAPIRDALECLARLDANDQRVVVFNFLVATTAKDVSLMLAVTELSHEYARAADAMYASAAADDRMLHHVATSPVAPECIRHLPANHATALGVFVTHDAPVCASGVEALTASLSVPRVRAWAVRAAIVDMDRRAPQKIDAYGRQDYEIVTRFVQHMTNVTDQLAK